MSVEEPAIEDTHALRRRPDSEVYQTLQDRGYISERLIEEGFARRHADLFGSLLRFYDEPGGRVLAVDRPGAFAEWLRNERAESLSRAEAFDINSRCNLLALQSIGIHAERPAPSLDGISLRQLVDSVERVAQASKGNEVRCDDRMLAALYLAQNSPRATEAPGCDLVAVTGNGIAVAVSKLATPDKEAAAG